MGTPWRVYSPGPAVTEVRSKRKAYRLARKLNRIGIQVSLYEASGDDWEPRVRLGTDGQPYSLPEDLDPDRLTTHAGKTIDARENRP